MNNAFDIAVLGAGPAGSHAAIAAAGAGLRVAVIDEQGMAGGQVWRAKGADVLSAPATPESRSGDALRARLVASGAVHIGDARLWQIERNIEGSAFALYVIIGNTARVVTARAVIIATGAREYVQPFPGWTLPGVTGLAGVTALMKRTAMPPGQRTVVAGTGPLVFFAASEIRRLGGTVAAVVTPHARRDWARALPGMAGRVDLLARGALWLADLAVARVPVLWRHTVTRAQGDRAVVGVEVATVDADWTPAIARRPLKVDSLCIGHGLIPSSETARMAGVDMEFDAALGGWVPRAAPDGTTDVHGVFVCGDGAGIRGADAAVIHGERAGRAAAGFLGAVVSTDGLAARYRRASRFGLAVGALSMSRPGLSALTTPDAILCRCESLSQAAVLAEIDSGAYSTNAVKSGRRAGMGPCGGAFCQTAIARLLAGQTGTPEADISLPTPRPPLRPVSAAALAGDFDYDALPIPTPAPL